MTRPLLDLVDRLCTGLASRWRNLFWRVMGVKIDGYCWLRSVEIPRLRQFIRLTRCSLDRGVVLLCGGPSTGVPKITIGDGTYVNRGTFIDAIESVHIGRQTAIGPGCYVTDHDHGTDVRFAPLDQPMVSKPTRIGDRVWLGAHVKILKGVTIGDDTVVGAGSIVTRDLPPRVIAVGSPARVVRTRVAEST